MSEIDVGQILSEMQRLVAAARDDTAAAPAGSATSFSDLLRTSIDKVNDMQESAASAAEAFEVGAPDVTLPEVMIALQKANLSFQAMTEVRNRLVSAYQEVMNMPI